MFLDKGFIKVGEGPLWPQNPYDSSGGNRTVADDMEISPNVIAAQMGMRLTPENYTSFEEETGVHLDGKRGKRPTQ